MFYYWYNYEELFIILIQDGVFPAKMNFELPCNNLGSIISEIMSL